MAPQVDMDARRPVLAPEPVMPVFRSLRPLHRVAAALLALGGGLAGAAEHAEAPKTAASAAAAVAPRAVHGPQDPLEMLREKLAAKLCATHAPADNANVVRVVSKASEAEADDRSTLTIAPRAARRRPASAAVTSTAALAPRLPSTWDYSGSGGPENWGRIKPEFAKCASGTRQSPIDIHDGIKVDLDAVQFDYKPGVFRVVDNGHTVQVNVAPGSSIDVMGRHYELERFDFQRPSEERIDGHQFEMGVHLIHKDADGHQAVVALLLERGSAQPIVQSVWNNLPLEKGDELAARAPFNPGDLLPAERGYFTYMGSLTAPPCSENVLWMVMKQPVQVSAEQIAIFARLYPMNARPVQSASGRLIKESN
jgi:carbonic anhydrase